MSSYEQFLEMAFLPSKAVIIDVGCNINTIPGDDKLDDFTEMALRCFPRAKVIGIDPIHYQAYEEKWGTDPRVTLVKKALSENNENCFMYAPEAHALSTFYDREVFKSWELIDQPKKIEVECISLTSLAKELNLPRINYLKIDAEGAEFAVLKGAEEYLASVAIDYVQFEHGATFKDAGYSFEDVAAYLSKFNYKELSRSAEDCLWVRG